MKGNIIKVGYCVAYDWELLKKSIPLIYNYADSICISIDKSRRSWSGQPYSIDENDFFSWLRKMDYDSKISIYEDDFYHSNLSSIENDNLQRNLMAKYMGAGGWHIQIDSDEYFLDFEGFRNYLLKINPFPTGHEKPINICCNLIPLFKKLKGKYLYVKNPIKKTETVPFATNKPVYLSARRNGHFNHISPFFVIHETWARGEEQLWQKLNNWGHVKDFNKESYFNLWKSLDEYNYHYLKNFHPINPEAWQELSLVQGETIEEIISDFKKNKAFELPKFHLFWNNQRNVKRIKAVLQRIKAIV